MEKQLWKPGNMLYPLPAVMVSCQREGERPNIITIAWTGTVCTNPAMVYISVRPERYSYSIIEETREFAINLTTGTLVRAADYCGVKSGRDVNKFKQMHLTPSPGETIRAPHIQESPVNIECHVVKIEEFGSHHMFLAEVSGVLVNQDYLDENGRFDLGSAGLLAYSHGEYFALGEKLGRFGYSIQKKKKK